MKLSRNIAVVLVNYLFLSSYLFHFALALSIAEDVAVHTTESNNNNNNRMNRGILGPRFLQLKNKHRLDAEIDLEAFLTADLSEAAKQKLFDFIPTPEDFANEIRDAINQIRNVRLTEYSTTINPPPKPSSKVSGCQIPDATAMLARPYRTVNLNTQINAGYAALADCFQRIIERGRPLGTSLPAWYAFAPYASRVVGKGEIGMEAALKLVASIKTRLANMQKELQDVASASGVIDTLTETADAVKKFTDYFLSTGPNTLIHDVLRAVVFVVAAFVAGGNAGYNKAILDVDVIKQTFMSFLRAVTPTSCPVFSCCPDLGDIASGSFTSKAMACAGAVGFAANNVFAFPRTLLNALEQGNRLIYTDIGVTGANYLDWRDDVNGGNIASLAITDFCVQQVNKVNAGQGQTVCQYVWQELQNEINDAGSGTRIANDFTFARSKYPSGGHMALKSSAFALYEQVAASSDNVKRNGWTKLANNMLAWVEQSDAAVPAFKPGKLLTGEVNRDLAFLTMSPFIILAFNFGDWSHYEYCKGAGIPITGRNWGDFRTRWTPILNAFDKGYTFHTQLFPLPKPYAMDGDP